MKARIKLTEGMTFVAESGSGHAIVVDAAPDVGGRNLGARPMEVVLMGTGACSAIDVVLILRRGRQPIDDCVVELVEGPLAVAGRQVRRARDPLQLELELRAQKIALDEAAYGIFPGG